MENLDKIHEEALGINKEVDLRKQLKHEGSHTDLSQQAISDFKDENETLERLSQDITSETLDRNFEKWDSHLERVLQLKIPDENIRKERLRKMTEFAKYIPLIHVARQKELESISLGRSIDSNFRITSRNDLKQSRTYDFDREMGLDKFSFFSYGHAMYMKHNEDVAFVFDPKLLEDSQTIVSLSDISDTKVRIMSQEGRVDNIDTWLDYLREMWHGNDFKKLFPKMCAIAFNDPQEYIDDSRFPLSIFPEWVTKPKTFSSSNTSVRFEIKIPKTISFSDLLFVANFENGHDFITKQPVKDIFKKYPDVFEETIEIPSNLWQRDEVIYKEARKRIRLRNQLLT